MSIVATDVEYTILNFIGMQDTNNCMEEDLHMPYVHYVDTVYAM